MLIGIEWYNVVILFSFVFTWCGTSFHMLIFHLHIFGQLSIKVFGAFFHQIVCFFFFFLSLKCLHILSNCPSSDVSLTNFSPSLWLVFKFFWHSLLQNRKFSFQWSSIYLPFLSWIMFLIFLSKKLFPYPKSTRFSFMLSSMSFIVLGFIFSSVIHFEFFCEVCKVCV